jgi:hypothetical protein
MGGGAAITEPLTRTSRGVASDSPRFSRSRPVRGRGVEGDLDALEPVALELATEERAQCLVEIGQRGVQGYVNDGRHWCGP